MDSETMQDIPETPETEEAEKEELPLSKEQLDSDAEKYFNIEQWYSMSAALIFCILCFGIGIPVWWSTTSVQRENLPYQLIEQSYSSQIKSRADLQLVVTQTSLKKHEVSDFGERVQEAFKRLNNNGLRTPFYVEFKGNIRIANADEALAVSINGSLESMSKILPINNNDINTIYLVKSKDIKPFIASSSKVLIPVYGDDLNGAISVVTQTCLELFNSSLALETYATTHGKTSADQSIQRRLKPSPAYTVVFTFMLPSSGEIDAVTLFDQAESYLDVIKQSFDGLVQFKALYQTLYYNEFKPKPITREDTTVLDSTKLPDLINIVESRIGASIEPYPSMNFIIIVPIDKIRPLHILDRSGQLSNDDSFFVPQWGGVSIVNPSTNSNRVDLNMTMSALIPMMMSLLGVPRLSAENNLEMNEGLPSHWELQQWVDIRTVENLGTAAHSMRSMSNLVQKIRNMVINEQIALQVTDALEAMTKSKQFLAAGNRAAALQQSQNALVKAEQAFYDTSLLELLYFPEDQKYAIYVPLFLPVCLPLLNTGLKALKYFKSRQQAAKTVKTE